MFATLRSAFSGFVGTPPKIDWVVDHAKAPGLPNGARRVLRHKPAGNGIKTIHGKNLELVRFFPGITYAEFYQAHAAEPLCDVGFLDSFIQLLVQNESQIDKIIKKYFGDF